MKSDYTWLKKWANELIGKNVLELGCGSGIDTRIIDRHAKAVIATDIADKKSAAKVILDHSKPLPFIKDEFEVVVASLCLHYFSWGVTSKTLSKIASVLRQNGLLICRLNSVNDYNYGAIGHPEIEAHMYMVDGEQKRFFDKADIYQLFDENWDLRNLKESSIDRYEKTKTVWEFGAVKAV